MKQLSKTEFAQLSQGETAPLKRIFESYFQNCSVEVSNISGCTVHEAGDFVMDAFIILREKVMAGEFENKNVPSFITSVALNRWRNRSRKYKRVICFDPQELVQVQNKSTQQGIKNQNPQEIELKAIRMALEKSSGKCGTLLRRNLYDGIPLEILVQELGYKSYDVIKTTKSRCMKKLRLSIKEILNEIHG